MNVLPAVGTPVDWSKYPRKDDYYINEEGMFEIA